jgi:Protein of unknown function (DUF1573)
MKRIVYLSLVFVVCAQFSIAQQRKASISFNKTAHNFGKIKEADGLVSTVFEFVNTGNVPVIIQDVQTSCGCTTPEYSKQPVRAGEKGFVKAVFDPAGRPGSFTKEITVKSNAENSPMVLKITGTVEQKEPSMEEQFRYTMGELRLQSSHIGFGKIAPGSSATQTINVLNPSKNAVKVNFIQVPPFLMAKAKPEVLKPGQKGVIEVTYNSAKKNDWGFLIDYLYFSLNGSKNPDHKVTITAEIIEDFSKMTEAQKANAPKISFDNPNYEFGAVKAGTKVDHDFTFTNKGKSDLIIRKINTTCGCTTSAPKDLVIKPGASSSIKAIFNTQGYKNEQTKVVTVITNDPLSSTITLWMKGKVE